MTVASEETLQVVEGFPQSWQKSLKFTSLLAATFQPGIRASFEKKNLTWDFNYIEGITLTIFPSNPPTNPTYASSNINILSHFIKILSQLAYWSVFCDQ